MTPKPDATDSRATSRQRELGFTLIELLAVIVILGILASIAVFALGNSVTNSAVASCKADFNTVELAAEAFKAQVGAYPGGTYTTGYTVSSAAVTGYSAPAATMVGGKAVDNNDGVLFLLYKADTDANSNSIGPWLHNAPVNNGHYEIVLSDPVTANGGSDFDQITVYAVNSSGALTGATIPAASPSHAITDCSSVK